MRTQQRAWIVMCFWLGLDSSSAAAPPKQHEPSTTTINARNSGQLIAAMKSAAASGKAVLIKLSAGTYSLSQSFSSDYGYSALPPVKTRVTIIGADSSNAITEINAQGFGRVFTVLDKGQLTVRHVTLRGGSSHCDYYECNYGGGGVGNFGGRVQLLDCVITANVAGSSEGESSVGGAILNWDGELRIDDCQLIENHSVDVAPGLAIIAGNAVINNSIVSANHAAQGIGNGGTQLGGGLYVGPDGHVSINGSTISGHHVGAPDDEFIGLGAGIYNAGHLLISHSAVIDNIASPTGGGGGIYNEGRLAIVDSTIGGNTAGTLGGGIYNSGVLGLRGVTIAHNESLGLAGGYESSYPPSCSYLDPLKKCYAGGGGIWNESSGTIYISSSAVADNAMKLGTIDFGPDCKGTLISLGNNAIGDTLDCTLTFDPELGGKDDGDLTNIDPRFGAFTDNGDPGEAHYPLRSDSPLIDAGGKLGLLTCGAFDQLYHRRVDGNGDSSKRCDVGAIEFQPPHKRPH